VNYYQKAKAARKVTYPQGITSTTTLQPISQLDLLDLQAPTIDSCSGLRGRVFAWGDISFLSKNIPSSTASLK
jgi:hypothetical protein